MFIDSARISVKAGDGGHGVVAFRRERFLPKGGPSGGNGGAGGDIIIAVDAQLVTLHDIQYQRLYKAGRGGHGAGSNKQGRRGSSLTIRVPPGTIIKDAGTDTVLADLIAPGDSIVAARRGAGGYGNAHFKSSRNRAPREATDGSPGEEREIALELKLLADVGLVGLPNAGKSTLLSRISAARPKVADYPFTTLEPHLGIVKYGEYKSFVMADIPGLILGASQGKGLGLQFLRHIERTRLLLYLIDASAPEPIGEQFQVLQTELDAHNPELRDRQTLIVLTKKDAWQTGPDMASLDAGAHQVHSISAVSGDGIEALIAIIAQILEETESVAAEAN